MAKEVKETVYKANADALEGLVWEWEAALDSRTCPTCMPLDQQRWDQGDSSRPEWPLHPNCRCQAVLVDPEDTEFADQDRTAVVIRPVEKGPYKQTKSGKAYKTPTRVKGQQFYRKTTTVTVTRLRPVTPTCWPSGQVRATPAWWKPWVSSGRRTSNGSWMSSTGIPSKFWSRCCAASQVNSSGYRLNDSTKKSHYGNELAKIS